MTHWKKPEIQHLPPENSNSFGASQIVGGVHVRRLDKLNLSNTGHHFLMPQIPHNSVQEDPSINEVYSQNWK